MNQTAEDCELAVMATCQGCGFRTYKFNLFNCKCGKLICYDCDRSVLCGKFGCDEKCGYCKPKCVLCGDQE